MRRCGIFVGAGTLRDRWRAVVGVGKSSAVQRMDAEDLLAAVFPSGGLLRKSVQANARFLRVLWLTKQ
jgi:hypothetical protein